ncbi:hypothetical protein DL770_002917 [Monosporascus sp. CRB-9-2]|nr:hypothetical protein DL770_002917 [Monosporascus sp. CRB-9-2]
MDQIPAPVSPDDPGRGPLIMGLTWIFAGLAIIATCMRFYIRTKLAHGLVVDDWLMWAAAACNIVSQAFVTVGYQYGLGKHDASLRPDQMMNVLKWMWLANTPGLIVGILACISIAILLVRLFRRSYMAQMVLDKRDGDLYRPDHGHSSLHVSTKYSGEWKLGFV